MINKKKTYPPGTYTGLGIVIGTGIGFMAGMLMLNSLAMGAGPGFVLGLIFGNSLEQQKKK